MRPTLLNFFFCDVSAINGIGDKLSKRIKTLCGPFLADLLWHLPSGVNYRPFFEMLQSASSGTLATFNFVADEHIAPPTKRQPYRVVGRVGDTSLTLVYFNWRGDYLTKLLPVGEHRFISGKVERNESFFQMLHPDYVTVRQSDIPVYETIYPLCAGLSNKILSKVIAQVVKMTPTLPEWLDGAYLKEHNLPDFKTALMSVHNPKSEADLSPNSAARIRLAYDELLANQLALLMVRSKMRKKKGFSIQGDGHLRNQLLANLPFALTGAQTKVLAVIYNDAHSDYKMLRLLQGDVGSGKTIVALLSLLNAVEAGFQGVIMAPTDILAHQHFETFSKLCEPLGVNVALLTGREKGKKRAELLQDLENNKIKILIGTHAVFVEDVKYAKLGLVVIDEQHKFGVHQRLALTQKQPGVDLFVMTATPIPRTLALTNYGDMDMSKLDEKPAGRQEVETLVLPASKIDSLAQKLKILTENPTQKTQVYWVCPLVEESEKSDLTAAIERYESLQELFGNKIGLVHGKMKGAEKDAVMAEFANGHLDILVSTTVIEVGVNVPTATVMVVEHAERFGLSQLHQLRGRIGRGNDKSTCLLVYSGRLSETAAKRLQVMRDTTDGFVIAEEDLKLRGSGEVLGDRQSGFLSFRMADLAEQGDLLWTATQDAKTILSLDSDLTSPRGQALKIMLYLFQKDTEIQTLKAG